jgi:hypothetical protein
MFLSTLERAARNTPAIVGVTSMGFIFRTIFWLGLAIVIVPPHARLGAAGGDGDVAWQDIDVGQELHNAAYAAWGLGVDAMSACDTNPELCKTAASLWDTTVSTATNLTADANTRWKDADAKAVKLAENEPRLPKKIQARVE